MFYEVYLYMICRGLVFIVVTYMYLRCKHSPSYAEYMNTRVKRSHTSIWNWVCVQHVRFLPTWNVWLAFFLLRFPNRVIEQRRWTSFVNIGLDIKMASCLSGLESWTDRFWSTISYSRVPITWLFVYYYSRPCFLPNVHVWDRECSITYSFCTLLSRKWLVAYMSSLKIVWKPSPAVLIEYTSLSFSQYPLQPNHYIASIDHSIEFNSPS